MLVVSNRKTIYTRNDTPTRKSFFLTEVFFPVHADSSFVGASDMSPEVHCNLCNHCYTLGMSDPRPDIRCVQYLPYVHKKVPNEFWASSGTSEVRNWHQRSKTSLDVKYRSTNIIGCQNWIQNIIRCQKTSHEVSWRASSSPTDVHTTQGGTSKAHHEYILDTCRILQVTSHPPSFSQGGPLHF
jgi:hypothetical protein